MLVEGPSAHLPFTSVGALHGQALKRPIVKCSTVVIYLEKVLISLF